MVVGPDTQTQSIEMGQWQSSRMGNETFPSERYIPTVIANSTARTARIADQHRRDLLLRALEKMQSGVMASDNEKKVRGIKQMLMALMGPDAGYALQLAHMVEEEIASESVLKVAGQKAHSALRTHAAHMKESGHPIHPNVFDIVSQFETAHVLSALQYETIQQLMPPGVAFFGADVNFWRFDADAHDWKQELKLDRLGREVTDTEFLTMAEHMKAFYCFPKSGEVKVLWDIGVMVLNGAAHEFHDQIEIISEPIDEWLFWKYILKARESGDLYGMNPHLPLIECLIENDRVKFLSAVSFEDVQAGLSHKRKRFKPSKADLAVVVASIKGNRPPRIKG